MVNLDELQQEIATLGDQIKALKASGGDGDAISAAVAALLAAKKLYADNNNGIGFDGQPYEEPLTKAQKKAKAKAEADAAASAASASAAGANGKQVRHLIQEREIEGKVSLVVWTFVAGRTLVFW
jgi:NAD(P)H-hydrate repair Nnr-like enzyme with NAD(P)H-hydrate dehydratase domain